MIDTFFSQGACSAVVRRLREAAAWVGGGSEAGDTLIEVVISALLVAIIAVGVTSGLNSTTKATALQRARSQADALAEQDEERLRALPINALVALESHPEKNTITVGNTKYTVESGATYIADATATESCNSSSPEADYLQTTSKVKWAALGTGKPVEETGAISPPPGADLIVQVTESGAAVPEAVVTVNEIEPKTWTHTLATSAKGCAIFPLPQGGEYSINAYKTGYVTPNGYENTDEDEKDTQKLYITAESTEKIGYSLGLAGNIQVNFTPTEGETFTAFNTGITSFKKLGSTPHQASFAWFGGEHQYTTKVTTSKELYPFTNPYIVYAGMCEANKPPTITAENEFIVHSGETTTKTIFLPPLTLKVYKGTNTAELLKGARVTITDTDVGCNSFKREFETNEFGTISRNGLPYGTYALCVSGIAGTPAQERRYEKHEIKITTASGVEQTVLLGESSPSSACP
jgi:Tfp pilus assembly protein PilV